jgi:hypothetical protein
MWNDILEVIVTLSFLLLVANIISIRGALERIEKLLSK